MKKNLTKKELEQLFGGIYNEAEIQSKNNVNRTEFCHCNFINENSLQNINKTYCCSCNCLNQ